MGYQQPQLGHQRGGDFDLGQIATLPQRLGDDIGVAGIGLGVAPIVVGHLVHRSTGDVPDPLPCAANSDSSSPDMVPGTSTPQTTSSARPRRR